MRSPAKRANLLAAALCSALLVAGCSNDSSEPAAEASTSTVDQTIAATLNDAPNMNTLSDIVSNARLGSVFDGPGSYTLLAPSDQAFEALGQEVSQLDDEGQRPVLVALLREHVLPGQLTPDNIADAIATHGGSVTMTTFGGSDVTFSDNDGTITVDNGQGTTGTLTGKAVIAQNGSIIALDKVLLPDGS